MHKSITVKYPESLANSLRLSIKDFEKEIKMITLNKLFELGRVSSGVASKMLGMSRLEFLESLSNYNVSFLESNDMKELDHDIENA